MAKSTLTDEQQVTEHISKLDVAIVPVVETLRKIILSTEKTIGEHIKWNNPCYYYTGEMKPFNPKEYKREIVVFNLYKGRIMMVFPSGARVNDTSGFLTGEYKDGRRIAIIEDLKDAKAKKKILQHVIREWLKGVEK
ncbi:MAG: DUF1801 domain-containing protein [Saprospiraceae bacterium]|nr:DUF1801 domain-containing protein [Candidatus Opimibacter iunctus]